MEAQSFSYYRHNTLSHAESTWQAQTWRAAIGPMVEQSTSSAAFRPGCRKPRHVSPERLQKFHRLCSTPLAPLEGTATTGVRSTEPGRAQTVLCCEHAAAAAVRLPYVLRAGEHREDDTCEQGMQHLHPDRLPPQRRCAASTQRGVLLYMSEHSTLKRLRSPPASAASSLGEVALWTPVSLQNARSFVADVSYTRSSCPPCSRFSAMRLPICPSPMKPTCTERHVHSELVF